MKRIVLLIAATVAFATAFATDYTWNGGTSGEWTEAANWIPNTGYPNSSNDMATFAPAADTAVTVATPVSVKGISVSGAGALTLTGSLIYLWDNGIASTSTAACGISNDVSIAKQDIPFALTGSGPLHMGGVISGEGGIKKTGHAYIHLYRDNTFKRFYQAIGDRTLPDGTTIGNNQMDKGGSGDTYIYAGGALGTSSAYFDWGQNQNNAQCARLIVVGGMTIDIPIQMTGDYNNNGSILFKGAGDVIFTKDLDSKGRARMRIDAAKNVYFNGDVKHSNYLDPFSSISSGANYYFAKPLSASCNFNGTASDAHVTAHLSSQDSVSWNAFLDRCTIMCEDENVLPPTFSYLNMNYAATRIDLNGFDQEIAYVNPANIKEPSSGSSHGIRSGRLARMRFVGSSLQSFGMRWTLYENAGFEWNPSAADVTFVQSNAVSSTHGELAVLGGVYRLANGASFTSLSFFEVADGATFEVVSGAGANFLAGAAKFGSSAKLKLAAGVNLKAGSLRIGGGQSIAVGTVLTKTTHPGLIEGDGMVTVTGEKILPFNIWQGEKGGAWTDPANWSAGVPSGDYEAYIADGEVVVDTTIPKVASIRVVSGGVITCTGPFTNENAATKIHLVCDNLTVEKGGKIDATQKGWSGGLYKGTNSGGTWSWKAVNDGHGYGPGADRDTMELGYCGASHGGLGGMWRLPGFSRRLTYGDAAQPTTAGSGGALPISYGGEISRDTTLGICRGWSGGGVIRIEATGSVRVDGEIRADGKGSGYNGSSRDCASAGGSVWITCETISGSGTISAEGGNLGDPRFPYQHYKQTDGTDGRYGHPGGGGRIAIDYDPTAEADANVTGLLLSAASGEYYAGYVTLATRDKYESKAEAGTIHLTDTALVKRLFGNGLSGRVVGLKSLAFDGDLDFRRGFFQSAEEGFELTVAGDLTITNAAARLEVGGLYMTNRAARAEIYAGTETNRLVVGGDLVVDKGGSFAIRSAAQPEVSKVASWGAEVTVGGELSIGNGSCVFAASDGITLASAKFTVGSLTVAEGGLLSADRAGGLGKDCHTNDISRLFLGVDLSGLATTRQASHVDLYGYGPGSGYKPNAAGHGGKGGRGFIHATGQGISLYGNGGEAYDDAWLPEFPGSGGSSTSTSGKNEVAEGGTGGGVIHVTSAGPIVVNGTVSADGWFGSMCLAAVGQVNNQAAGSGGTVYLAGETVSFGADAKVSAKGGDALQSGATVCAATGGGGRIAIWTGADNLLKDSCRVRKLDVRPAEFAEDVFDVDSGDPIYYNGTTTRNEQQLSVLKGAAGTVAFGRYDPKPGMMIILR